APDAQRVPPRRGPDPPLLGLRALLRALGPRPGPAPCRNPRAGLEHVRPHPRRASDGVRRATRLLADDRLERLGARQTAIALVPAEVLAVPDSLLASGRQAAAGGRPELERRLAQVGSRDHVAAGRVRAAGVAGQRGDDAPVEHPAAPARPPLLVAGGRDQRAAEALDAPEAAVAPGRSLAVVEGGRLGRVAEDLEALAAEALRRAVEADPA